MKRGFLNSKKAKAAKDNTLCDSTGSYVAPPRQFPPSGDSATAVSGPKESSEPVVGFDVVEHIPSQLSGAILLHPHAVVRIPSLTLTKSKELSTICLFRMPPCSAITNTPGFYTPPPPQNLADAVFTKNMQKMGVGLFAKRNLDSFEEVLQLALKGMTKEDADAFTSLSNCFSDSPVLYGISSTNGFATTIEERNPEEGKFGYVAIGKLASRINHSCSPNVDVNFDIPTFSIQITALRDIEAGQQLFYCYCSIYQSAKERQSQLLTTHNFACQCQACVNATPESDKLREGMIGRIEKLTEEAKKVFANPQFNLRSLDPWLKLEKEIVKEGLDFGVHFVVLLFDIFQAYEKLRNIPKQREYANKCQKLRKTGSTEVCSTGFAERNYAVHIFHNMKQVYPQLCVWPPPLNSATTKPSTPSLAQSRPAWGHLDPTAQVPDHSATERLVQLTTPQPTTEIPLLYYAPGFFASAPMIDATVTCWTSSHPLHKYAPKVSSSLRNEVSKPRWLKGSVTVIITFPGVQPKLPNFGRSHNLATFSFLYGPGEDFIPKK